MFKMFNKTTALLTLTLAASLPAFGDFSYARTQKVTGGSMAAMAGTTANTEGKTYLKGQKMAITAGATSTVIDFDTQTITTISNGPKTYKVQKFTDLAGAAAGANVSAEVRETGQKKMVNGFNASETLLTLDMDLEMGRGQSMKMQAEVSIWTSPDVPGAGEMHAFFQKNAANFPWASLMGGGNQSIAKAIAQLQKTLAGIDGMAVEEVIRVKPAGGADAPQVAQMPQMNSAQQAQMAAATQKLQEMAKQGGAAGAAAQQALTKMGAMGGGGAAAGAGGSPALIEVTIDNTGFSTADVPDSVFGIPAGFKQIP